MQIPHFAADQNIVFLPALLPLLAATVLFCLPILFAPGLRRSKRRVPLLVLDAVVVVALLVGTAVLGGIGFRTLGDERAAVQADIQQQYGLRLDGGQVGELVDGGKPLVTMPDLATALGLKTPQKPHSLKLVPAKGADAYDLTFGGKPYPKV